jgi:predicted Zn-dependent protease
MYHDMIGLAPPHSIMREGLAQLAFSDTDDLLAILPGATPEEAEALIGNLLQNDPSLSHLTSLQRHALFAAWWTQGSQAQLMTTLQAHPEWDNETWLYQARFAAQQNDFQHACSLCAHWVKAPAVPQISSSRGLGDLAADFQANPNSLTDGLTLFLAQMQAGQNDAALATLAKLRTLPGDHPAYLAYLEAQIDSDKNDWAAAWAAWQSFLGP